MPAFDRKFGSDFLAGVPLEPGTYRLYDAAGALISSARPDLRRRLAQYRTTRRTKKDRKRRALVKAADRIEWQVCASELEAALTEVDLIQHRRKRSQPSTSTAPFARARSPARRFSRSCGCSGSSRIQRPAAGVISLAYRATPTSARSVDSRPTGPSCGGLSCVAPRAPRWRNCHCVCWTTQGRARSAGIGADLRTVERFFDSEASTLAAAVAATGYVRYPVPQRDRDALLLRYRAVM